MSRRLLTLYEMATILVNALERAEAQEEKPARDMDRRARARRGHGFADQTMRIGARARKAGTWPPGNA